MRFIRALVPRMVWENPAGDSGGFMANCGSWGVKVASSTVWEILQDAGIDPAPNMER